jgi:hypothetical protein
MTAASRSGTPALSRRIQRLANVAAHGAGGHAGHRRGHDLPAPDGWRELFALEPVDGATIRRVLDNTGRTPLPPDPAYQQIIKGLPPSTTAPTS